MKRKLDKKEIEKTKKGLKKINNDIVEICESLKILKLHRDFRKKKREYEDLVRPYNREKEDKETENLIKQMEADLKMKETTKKELNIHLTEGVEVKKPIGVE